jgi:hypothetical protein
VLELVFAVVAVELFLFEELVELERVILVEVEE